MGSQPTRIAYVTGGMGGIGTAICRRLCREGHTVIAGCGPGSARRDRWVSEMRAEGCNIRASEGNVSDWDSTRRAFDVARAEVGEIDILVNNAGITRDGMFQKMTNEAWHAVIETNLNSLFHVTKQVIDGMLARGWGRIVNISSVNGQRGQFGQTNYSTAKAGIHGFTMALAQEVAARGAGGPARSRLAAAGGRHGAAGGGGHGERRPACPRPPGPRHHHGQGPGTAGPRAHPCAPDRGGHPGAAGDERRALVVQRREHPSRGAPARERRSRRWHRGGDPRPAGHRLRGARERPPPRSEEHTSELQSP